MIHLRVSTLEHFRRVVSTPWGREAELVDAIRRGQWADGPASDIMRAGTAFHAILAAPEKHAGNLNDAGDLWPHYASGGFAFDAEDVARALEHVGPGECEVSAFKDYVACGQLVRVHGTCDRIRGLAIRDAKCKFSTPDAKDYELSLQWRYYLDIFGGAWFTYDLLEFTDLESRDPLRLKGITSFRFWPYPEMADELTEWVADFLEWAECKGLMDVLRGDRKAA